MLLKLCTLSLLSSGCQRKSAKRRSRGGRSLAQTHGTGGDEDRVTLLATAAPRCVSLDILWVHRDNIFFFVK